jgi:hypothetical protein
MPYSYDRRSPRIAKLEMSDVREPLYGHTDEKSAYIIESYPYGSLRTQMRVWLEDGGAKGWRHVTQTLNPKSGRWNNPKKSTYSQWAGNLYLDNRGHVQWAGLGPYSSEEDFEAFVRKFPKSDMRMIKKIIPAKVKMLEKLLSGEAFFSVNNVRQEPTELEQTRRQGELEIWKSLDRHVH